MIFFEISNGRVEVLLTLRNENRKPLPQDEQAFRSYKHQPISSKYLF